MSGGELASLILTINTYFLHRQILFYISNCKDCFQLSNDDPPFIVLATLLQRSWALFSPSSKRASWMKSTISGNDSKNLVTHCFVACGASLALPVLKYILLNTASYKAQNILTAESQNSITSDIGSVWCLPPSSVNFLKPERSLGAVVVILTTF